MALAPYATQGDFAPDIERVVYSNAYRRLAHKTQIIIKPTRDHFRSRLIHTEEVNQIACSLGRRLDLNLELIGAVAKGHDLGHTPFGHAGERTLQQILERELSSRFGIKPPHKREEREGFKRGMFHHSLNSARMLLKEEEFDGISPLVVEGVLTHSWSPWGSDGQRLAVPRTYEAQVVAIADQIASINHDTEDIIEGAPYTEYDRERFNAELINGFRAKHPGSFKDLQREILSLIVDKSVERGFGRQRRVDTFVRTISETTRERLGADCVDRPSMATSHPISLPDQWADFLKYYETFIRYIIQERVSWFIARDNMAGALISTVFNHIWPRAKGAYAIKDMKPLFERVDLVKSKYEEKTRYLEHFVEFFKEHYFDESEKKDSYGEYQRRVREAGIATWDVNIIGLFKDRIPDDLQRQLTRLFAVIDFVAGLTDRYCLEMFNEVYQEFVIT